MYSRDVRTRDVKLSGSADGPERVIIHGKGMAAKLSWNQKSAVMRQPVRAHNGKVFRHSGVRK